MLGASFRGRLLPSFSRYQFSLLFIIEFTYWCISYSVIMHADETVSISPARGGDIYLWNDWDKGGYVPSWKASAKIKGKKVLEHALIAQSILVLWRLLRDNCNSLSKRLFTLSHVRGCFFAVHQRLQAINRHFRLLFVLQWGDWIHWRDPGIPMGMRELNPHDFAYGVSYLFVVKPNICIRTTLQTDAIKVFPSAPLALT